MWAYAEVAMMDERAVDLTVYVKVSMMVFELGFFEVVVMVALKDVTEAAAMAYVKVTFEVANLDYDLGAELVHFEDDEKVAQME